MIRAEVRRLTHIDAMMSQFSFPIMLLPDSADDIDFDTDPGRLTTSLKQSLRTPSLSFADKAASS